MLKPVFEFASDVRLSFKTYVQEELLPKDSARFTSILDYIAAWLYNDDGAKVTKGDYTAHVHAVLIINAIYKQDPRLLYYDPVGHSDQRKIRRAKPLDLRDPAARSHRALNPEFYSQAYLRAKGRRPR